MTRASAAAELRALGVGRPGAQVVMAHAALSRLGWVVGGAQALVEALLDALGPDGTLLVLTGWEDAPPYHQDDVPADLLLAYEQHCPPFDPRLARAERDNGRLAEAVRTWPGAAHSRHPVSAFAAVGAGARWLVDGQDLDGGFGPGSPLARLVEAGGSVLLLGAPRETVTLLHLAEHLAEVPAKRWVELHVPVLVDGERRWRRTRELDSTLGAVRYEDLGLAEDAFAAMVGEALAAGIGRTGAVGAATAALLPAGALLAHAVAWLESRFGSGGTTPAAGG